ncbi:unnamed protein product [Strongylus vulgaris]|uniref:Uncharacterized protein n=1 Tax=Strongylus vulgaris TaxID=40348 RepID=A0A3P7LMR2_STRVU|nr:unnamed protein product [Strongylus vulgaris]
MYSLARNSPKRLIYRLLDNKQSRPENATGIADRAHLRNAPLLEAMRRKSMSKTHLTINVPISEKNSKELHQHWVEQAFSGLMAAIATDRLPKVSATERERHHNCAKKADDVRTHAKCNLL